MESDWRLLFPRIARGSGCVEANARAVQGGKRGAKQVMFEINGSLMLGIAIGVVVATICCVLAAVRDDLAQRKKRTKK